MIDGETVPLWGTEAPPHGEAGSQQHPTLTLFPAKGARGTVIVCPGGGYGRLANSEGEPVARWLNSIGISALVLQYRCSPNRHPAPLKDALRAIRYAKHLASDWGQAIDKIGILGFSAGGHLAATAGTLYDDHKPRLDDPIERHDSRPDAMVLCYPAITFQEPFVDRESMENLLGEQPSVSDRSLLSVECHVNRATPPAFIWSTADDHDVLVQNSLLMAQALSQHFVPYELHIFEDGDHGLGLCSNELYTASAWTRLCEAWLRKRGF